MSLAVLDIDGVLADVTHRLRHIEAAPPRWGAFFNAAGDDPPLAAGLELAALLAAEHTVTYLSGRPEWLRATTETWLAEHGLPSGAVTLRDHDDRRPAAVFKVSALRELARTDTVAAFVDDDPDVVDAAVRAGFPAVLADWSQRTRSAALNRAQRGGRT